MKTCIAFLVSAFILTSAGFSQNTDGVRMKVTLSRESGDTLDIKRFNRNGDQTFRKIFSPYGLHMMLGWDYEDDRLVRFTWSHATAGINDYDYEYLPDPASSRLTRYEYKRDGKDVELRDRLLSFHSIAELRGSFEFNSSMKTRERVLNEVNVYQDGLIKYKMRGKPGAFTDSTIYFYEDGLRTHKTLTEGIGGTNSETIYEYNASGQPTREIRVRMDLDRPDVFEYWYEDGKLVKEVFLKTGKRKWTKTYGYENGNLHWMSRKNAEGVEKMSEVYLYRKDGRVDVVYSVNKYLNKDAKVYHFYY